MEIALYELRADENRYKYIKEVTDWAEKDDSYIRVSDVVDVLFVMVDDSITIPIKVEALKIEKVLIAKEFDKKISKLLAIEHRPAG